MAVRSRNPHQIMETTTSFDLNRAIQEWRQRLSTNPSCSAEDLAELESHLRDSIADLRAKGLSESEAFMVASSRLGNERLLEGEFAKVNSGRVWLDRVFWMLIGIQLWGMIGSSARALAQGAATFGLLGLHFNFRRHAHPGAMPDLAGTGVFILVQLVGLAGSLALCWWMLFRYGSAFGTWIHRFMNRPASLALLGGGVLLIALLLSAIPLVVNILTVRVLDQETFGSAMVTASYATWVTWPAQTVLFVVMTLSVARRRFRTASV